MQSDLFSLNNPFSGDGCRGENEARGADPDARAGNVPAQFEEWRPVESAPGYFVSSLGRFRGPRGFMRGSLNWTGYRHIGPVVDGKQRFFLAHRLVAEAFLPSCVGPIVNHKDGNRDNNCVSNLEWSTYSENSKDFWKRRHANVAATG